MIWKQLSSRLGLMVGLVAYFMFRDSTRESFGDWAPVALLCCVYALFWLIGWAGYFLQDRLRSESELPTAELNNARVSESAWNARTAAKLAIAVSIQAAFAAAFGYWRGNVSDGMVVFATGVFSIQIYTTRPNSSASFQFSLRMLFWWTTVVAICVVVLTSLPPAMPSEWRVLVSILVVVCAISLSRLIWKYRLGAKGFETYD